MNEQATSARRAQRGTAACGEALVRKEDAAQREVSAEAEAGAGEESAGIRRCKGLAAGDRAGPEAEEPAAAADCIQEKEMT